MDCVFCKIIKKEIPASFIYENNKSVAFLVIKPVNKGHTVVVPKHHCENILTAPDEELKDIILTVKKVAKIIVEFVGADGWNLQVNNGEAAGQVVMHSHFHIIPRFKTDKFKNWPHLDVSSEELNKLAEEIKSKLKIH
jgi:histidine triad (HIT) family protein